MIGQGTGTETAGGLGPGLTGLNIAQVFDHLAIGTHIVELAAVVMSVESRPGISKGIHPSALRTTRRSTASDAPLPIISGMLWVGSGLMPTP